MHPGVLGVLAIEKGYSEMKIRIIFKPRTVGLVPRTGERDTVLQFLQVQDEAGNSIDGIPAFQWAADGDFEALIIDTDKLAPPPRRDLHVELYETVNGVKRPVRLVE